MIGENFMLLVGQAMLVFSISYIVLYVLLKEKIGGKEPPKDILIVMSLGITLIVFSVPVIGEFMKNFMAFITALLIFIFGVALIFGLAIGKEVFSYLTKKSYFTFAILVTLIFAGVIFGATAYWNYQVKTMAEQQGIQNQTAISPFNRKISPVERVIFDPRVISTIAFLIVFAVILYVISKGG